MIIIVGEIEGQSDVTSGLTVEELFGSGDIVDMKFVVLE